MMGQQEIEERRGRLRDKFQELGQSIQDYRDLAEASGCGSTPETPPISWKTWARRKSP